MVPSWGVGIAKLFMKMPPHNSITSYWAPPPTLGVTMLHETWWGHRSKPRHTLTQKAQCVSALDAQVEIQCFRLQNGFILDCTLFPCLCLTSYHNGSPLFGIRVWSFPFASPAHLQRLQSLLMLISLILSLSPFLSLCLSFCTPQSHLIQLSSRAAIELFVSSRVWNCSKSL